jgi:8-oxo-dGTP pyrophosphatase MutT (NUDIX family)
VRQSLQVLVYPVKAAENGWEYLLLHRLASRGDFWQGITGGVEAGEEIADAAKRELIEETGLVPATIHKIDYSFSYPVAEKWRHLYTEGTKEITEYVFLAQVDDQRVPILDAREHDQWKWCDVEDARSLLIWPGNVEALKHCDTFLRSRSSGS